MNAEVTVQFKLPNICDVEDLEAAQMTFEEMVRWLIREEGLLGLVSGRGHIISVEEAT